MKTKIKRNLFLLVGLCLLFASTAFGQGARFDSVAQKNVQGFLAPIPGATITVCTSAATGTPCTPLVPTSPVTLCTDSTCAVAATNPFPADSNGNWGFWALPGTYKVSITGTGVTGQLVTVTLPCAAGISCASSSGNNTFTGVNSFTQISGCQHVNASQAFAAAATAVGTAGCLIVDPGTYTVSANATVPIGVTLAFSTNGLLSIANAVTLTINGPLAAPLQQIFSYTGSGTVALGPTAVGSGVYPQWWGAVADGVTDSAPATRNAIAALPNSGIGTVLFSRGQYRWNSTVVANSGLTLAGVDQPERWRLGQFYSDPTKILYFGTGSAISLTAAASAVVDTFCIKNLHIDGTNATGSVDGILLTATAAGAAIEGVTLQNVTVTNFPRNQIHISGIVFDVSSYRLTLHNQARAVTGPLFYSDNLGSQPPSQFTFDDAYILPYTAGQWGAIIEVSQDTRFIGGTISGQSTTPGANGLFLNGGCDIIGTHFEGVDNTSTGNVALRYVGSNGCRIRPDFMNFWGYQVQVGMPVGTTYTTASSAVINPASAAKGAIVGGNIAPGANVTNSGAAVLVTAGGTRRGTSIETLGYSQGSPATIVDLRASTDGVNETSYMYDTQMQVPGVLSPTAAGQADVGTTALPFGNLWLGTGATNNFKFQPASTTAARIITLADPLQTTVALPMTIASGTKALNTASITTATCDGGASATATGTLSTDTVDWSFNAAPTATNKYGAFLVVYAVPSTNTVTFYTCNPSATTSTPTAMTVNFSVRRP